MVIGLLRLELFIPHARSLKDKRMVLRRLRDRLRARFNVAVAEIDFQDTWQRALVGVATLNEQRAFVEKVLDAVLRDVEATAEAEVVGRSLEFF